MLQIIFILLSAALTAITCIFGVSVTSFYDFYKPILLFVAFYLAVLILFFVMVYILTLFVNKKKPIKKPSPFFIKIAKLIDDLVLGLLHIKIVVTGRELLDKNKNYFFCCNHLSNFDPFIIFKALSKYNIQLISKPENFSIPLVGGIIHKIGFMPIDRNNDREALKTILASAEIMKKGYTVGAYPEGTRNKSGKGLKEFKHGLFKAATKAKVDIVSVTVRNTEKIKNNLPFKKTVVYFDILKVYTTESYSGLSTRELGTQIHDEMLDFLTKENQEENIAQKVDLN